jgi:hypothetical protein
MSKPHARSQDQIFADMFRQIRTFAEDTPESPERLDPILRLMMRLFAHQVEGLDEQMKETWDVAKSSLVRTVCPGFRRRPVPAHTIMRCRPVDPSVTVDMHTRFYFREEREGGQAYFFSPLQMSQVVAGQVASRFVRRGTTVQDLAVVKDLRALSAQAPDPAGGSSGWELWLGLTFDAAPSSLDDLTIFLQGDEDWRRQIRWGRWHAAGGDAQADGFCPGLMPGIEERLTSRTSRLGSGLRTTSEMIVGLTDQFVVLDKAFLAGWQPGFGSTSFRDICQRSGLMLDAAAEKAYWLRIDLPEGGDKSVISQSWDLLFDCLIAVNRTELTLFKHTGGRKLVEMEIPEAVEQVVDVVSVTDSSSREYVPQDSFRPQSHDATYSMEERDGHFVLWFDYTRQSDPPPDSITITYAVTRGTDANGIGAGKIQTLYEGHPGLEAVSNVTGTTGAIPARSEEQVMQEVAVRLRQRDRALTFEDVAAWARTFDPRVTGAHCSNGVDRIDGVACRCIVVEVTLDHSQFVSDDEIDLLKRRLVGFLRNRSTVNTRFKIQVAN